MFFTLIGTIFAGFAGAGMVMLLRFALKNRIPGWATPVAAGVAMLAATIGSEYGWYENTRRTIPDTFEIVSIREERDWYRPWTYIIPFVSGFVSIDRASEMTNEAVPGVRLIQGYIFQRFGATNSVPMLVDCPGSRRAEVIDGLALGEDGTPTDVDWVEVPEDDALLRAVCGGTAAS